jgi:hypothetical protein
LSFYSAIFLGDHRTKAVGGAFGIEAVVRKLLIPAESPAHGEITPEEGGDPHDGQEQTNTKEKYI